MQKLDASITPSQLRPFVTDLGDLKAVQTTAKKMMETTDRLDILINNAGLLAKPLDLDSQGVSVSFNTK
jgi:NADP-dependent 3-hydroxy acid dehydrogenase YdfG